MQYASHIFTRIFSSILISRQSQSNYWTFLFIIILHLHYLIYKKKLYLKIFIYFIMFLTNFRVKFFSLFYNLSKNNQMKYELTDMYLTHWNNYLIYSDFLRKIFFNAFIFKFYFSLCSYHIETHGIQNMCRLVQNVAKLIFFNYKIEKVVYTLLSKRFGSFGL